MVVDVHDPSRRSRGGGTMGLRLLGAIGVVMLLAATARGRRGYTRPDRFHRPKRFSGKIIVGAGGRTLYDSTMDRAGMVACTGSCATRWLPLVTAAHVRPMAGSGVVASMLGTIERPDGRWQVTYRRHPLYLFSGDSHAGQVNGQGVAGRWHAVSPSGVAVTRAPRAGCPPPTRLRARARPVTAARLRDRRPRRARTSACGAPRTRSRA